ncbi:MAG: DUF3592 domain-containing protein [Candidatus Dadabacteria bacterium]|nr:MAG: DUF3592 domain-containing protein [Candidatus Dadabacteria bacterium]
MGKSVIFIRGLFFVAAVAGGIGCYYWTSNINAFLEKAIVGDGKVVDLIYKRTGSGSSASYSYFPVVEFNDVTGARIRFESRVGTNPPAYAKGETVRVLYDPADPTAAKIDSFMSLWFGPLLVAFFAVVFGSISIGWSLWNIAKERREKWLRENGQRVEAKISRIKQKNYSVNGKVPWVICSEWKDPRSGETLIFESDNIWFDPRSYIADKDAIAVYIDPENPKKHAVDTSFLPEARV